MAKPLFFILILYLIWTAGEGKTRGEFLLLLARQPAQTPAQIPCLPRRPAMFAHSYLS
jgi:hypothetical protein